MIFKKYKLEIKLNKWLDSDRNMIFLIETSWKNVKKLSRFFLGKDLRMKTGRPRIGKFWKTQDRL